MRVLIRPFEPDQLLSTVTHLARLAEMRKSTHAMASVVASREERDDEVSTSDSPAESVPPRSIFPRKS